MRSTSYQSEATMKALALEVAKGHTIYAASKLIGKSASYCGQISRKPGFAQMVEEAAAELQKTETVATAHTRGWVDAQMRYVYEWCIGTRQVAAPCKKCGQKFERLRETKHAVKLLEMFGLEQGMFKRQLDVTSRKVGMIEGGEMQVLGQFAALLDRLGAASTAKVLTMISEENLRGAMKINGYRIERENGRSDSNIFRPEGDADDGGEGGESDSQPVLALSETASLS